MTSQLLPLCICGSGDAEEDRIHGIPVLRCKACGVVRQQVLLTLGTVSAWYREHYHSGAYTHSYDHDAAVADLRLKAYGLLPGTKLLDVGCGNSAFIDVAREKGLDAWGQDLAAQSEGDFTYVGPLEDIAFPTDSFDAVTLHDVLEHFPQPQATLEEIARILRPGGKLIVDFPRFYHKLGAHHWKRVEHLWMFTEAQLAALIEKTGFSIKLWYNPIASKIVVWAERKVEKRPQILVPSGIGDTYWVMTKLPGFLRTHRLSLPDVWVQDANKGLKRAEPFLQTIPFVHAAGYKDWVAKDPVFHEAYFQDGRTVFPDALGVDYFIAYNGVLRVGRSLEEVDPAYGCEWFPRMHVSKAARAYQAQLEAGGPYVVGYFIDHGMYSRWLAQFSIESIEAALRAISQMGLRIVMVGATWDIGSLGDVLAQRNPEWTNLVGKTTYEELLGTLRGASAVVGFPSGATILGPVLRRPTVILWNEYFRPSFWVNSVPPGTPYQALNTNGLQSGDVLGAVLEVLAEGS